MYNTFDVDVLVNGKPVRKYSHNGKIFIEAREGIQYTLKIKNQNWYRKLVSCSVDGLNVLDGKSAGDTDSGYIINGLNSIDIKGFRVSDDAVNAFQFAKKSSGKTYAQNSDEAGYSSSNCGVIAFKFFDEKVKPAPIIKRIIEEHHHHHWPRPWRQTPWWEVQDTHRSICSDNTSDQDYDTFGNQTKSLGNARGINPTTSYNCSVQNSVTTQDFDMGTEFSQTEINDKVVEVPFEQGSICGNIEIYYASREALISWGVPVEKETQVSFPNPFPSKSYCKPPRR